MFSSQAGRHPLQSSDDDDDEFRPVSFLRNGNHASYQQVSKAIELQSKLKHKVNETVLLIGTAV